MASRSIAPTVKEMIKSRARTSQIVSRLRPISGSCFFACFGVDSMRLKYCTWRLVGNDDSATDQQLSHRLSTLLQRMNIESNVYWSSLGALNGTCALFDWLRFCPAPVGTRYSLAPTRVLWIISPVSECAVIEDMIDSKCPSRGRRPSRRRCG